jgi:type IV secretory pathway VirB3-like protein
MRSTPVHACLLEVKSAAGAEFMPVVINVTVMVVMLIGPNIMWWPLLTYFVHKFFQWMFFRDPHLTRIFAKYLAEGDVYDPWPKPSQRINKRPVGAGRDLLC